MSALASLKVMKSESTKKRKQDNQASSSSAPPPSKKSKAADLGSLAKERLTTLKTAANDSTDDKSNDVTEGLATAMMAPLSRAVEVHNAPVVEALLQDSKLRGG